MKRRTCPKVVLSVLNVPHSVVKQYSESLSSKLYKDSVNYGISSGILRKVVTDIEQYSSILNALDSNQVVIHGQHVSGRSELEVTTEKELAEKGEGYTALTKDSFVPAFEGCGTIHFNINFNRYLKECAVKNPGLNMNEPIRALAAIWPELGRHCYVRSLSNINQHSSNAKIIRISSNAKLLHLTSRCDNRFLHHETDIEQTSLLTFGLF